MRYPFVQRRKIYFLWLLLLSVCTVRAQYDASFSHYFDMQPSFNPAAVGKQDQLNINAAYAMSMVGFQNNPKTMYAAADMPFYFLKAYHGGGVQLMNDQIGLFTHQRLAAQYALRFKLFGGKLSAGVQAGMLSESFDGTKLNLADANDPAFTNTQVKGNALDIGAGLYYFHSSWYVGISAQHLTSPVIDLTEKNQFHIDATYYLTAGYNIHLRNPFLTIQPSVLVRTDGVAYRGDVTARLVYQHEKRMMYGGVGYSPTNSVTFLVGGSFHGAVLGYSYELYTSAIQPGNGSHELFVGYQMDVNLAKKGRNKHKSVRLL
ncbi:PorP/SprF family type IX secretion system membrane protein [Hoylesella timonensis]|uniref:PorP/SprF family type IX secretion system membrane protein n=1 Tax=Hoylesella timonensis TaxID=386414 RepID=UPI00336A941E